MKKVYSYKEKRRLKIGEVVDFKVIKLVVLPDGEEYFVIQDPYNEKHLLPAKYYQNYRITKNEYIKCHVDKVNCKGQIFLEPLHPEYTVGKCYDFKFLKQEKIVNRKEILIANYILEGLNGYIAYLIDNEPTAIPEKRVWKKYKVIKIKKAKVFLTAKC